MCTTNATKVIIGSDHLHFVQVKAGVPGKFQNMVEIVFEFVQKAVNESYHGKSKIIAPLALVVFLWIFLMNVMDMLPVDLLPRVMGLFGVEHFKSVPTADPNTTFAMSFVVFFFKHPHIVFWSLKCCNRCIL